MKQSTLKLAQGIFFCCTYLRIIIICYKCKHTVLIILLQKIPLDIQHIISEYTLLYTSCTFVFCAKGAQGLEHTTNTKASDRNHNLALLHD